MKRIAVATNPKRKMKTMNTKTNRNLNTILCLSMVALLTATLSSPAAAAKRVPFKGVIAGTEDFNFKPNGSGIIIPGSGGGNSTHLGRFAATWNGNITFGNLVHPLTRTFVAANGDKIFSEGLGAGTEPTPASNFNQFIVEEQVITGGTGRFKGAKGSFIVQRMVFDVRSGVDIKTSGRFFGTIILAKSK